MWLLEPIFVGSQQQLTKCKWSWDEVSVLYCGAECTEILVYTGMSMAHNEEVHGYLVEDAFFHKCSKEAEHVFTLLINEMQSVNKSITNIPYFHRNCQTEV